MNGVNEALIWKIKDHEKRRLLDLKYRYKQKEHVDLIEYLIQNYNQIINKNVFDIEKDKNILAFDLLGGIELYKVKAGLSLIERYREILQYNKKHIY